MRVLFALMALMPLASAAPCGGATLRDLQAGRTNGGGADCPRGPNDLSDKARNSPRAPLVPRKLTELPPATAYMAVYRHIGPCQAPLTMANYRKTSRR